MKIISISGLDGSGKSTQINLLKAHLEAQGKKVFYFHAVQFSIANSYKLRDIKYEIQDTKSVTQASWLKIQLRKIALAIDLCRFRLLLQKLRRQNYDFILSDRYFYDNLINIAYLEAKSCQPKAIHFIPTPTFAFYLKTDPEKIMQRDRAPEQGLVYLQTKQKLFDDFAAKHGLQIINGDQAKEIVFENILAKIEHN